jgi:hypothetical protein
MRIVCRCSSQASTDIDRATAGAPTLVRAGIAMEKTLVAYGESSSLNQKHSVR